MRGNRSQEFERAHVWWMGVGPVVIWQTFRSNLHTQTMRAHLELEWSCPFRHERENIFTLRNLPTHLWNRIFTPFTRAIWPP